jgi:hypothetical protein
MTYNVLVLGEYKLIMDHIARCPNEVRVRTYEDFNGQTMHTGVDGLGFQTEEERLGFVLAMSDKLWICETTDKDIKWGHTGF